MLKLSQVICNDTMMQIKKGNVVDFSSVRPYGITDGVGLAGTMNDIWKVVAAPAIKVRTNPTVAKKIGISSSDNADITQYLTIVGLDANYEIQTVTKLLAGQTKTALSTDVYFLRILSATLDVACAGNVFVYDYSDAVVVGVPQTATKVYAEITIADLQDYNAQLTMPVGEQGWLYAVTWNSDGTSIAANKIVIQAVITYEDATTQTIVCGRYDEGTAGGSGTLQFTASPILIPEKADFKLQASLVGGTALNIEVWAEIIVEDVATPTVDIDVLTKGQYDAQLAPHTLASTKLYLIGLDEVPTAFPTIVDLNNTLAIITGEAIGVGKNGYHVAATTEVAFKIDVFTGGLLVNTTKKAIACVWRCVDSNGDVLYNSGLTPQIIILGGKTLKTTFTTV